MDFGESENQEHYWSIIIEPGWVQASIWKIDKDAGALVKSLSPATHWETDENLIDAVDTCLTASVQNLLQDSLEPTKTVFGLPPSWVTNGEIKREYLDSIRKICSKLSLDPSGFVVLPEAIAHLIKSDEGSPLTAVVIGVGQNSIDVTLFKLGNLAGTSSVARSVSIVDDVVEGLTRFEPTGDPFPSRFIIYNGKEGELEEARQALIAADWIGEDKKPKFLHVPKVEIVDPEKKVLAVSLAGASEIGGASKVSFEKEVKEDVIPEPENVKAVSPTDVGFVIDQDVNPNKLDELTKKPMAQVNPKVAQVEKLSSFSRKNYFLFGGVLSIFILILGFILWWFFPKATVTIYVSPKRIEGRETLTIDPKEETGNLLKTQLSGEKTASTTGTKKVGEKAKGSVKIRNGTGSIINLSSAVVLLGPNDLRFSLDSSASVSAALSPSDPGTATLEVTSTDIGAEYNLAKDETFKVGNFPKSEVDAVSTDNFSGGSSRDIAAVSPDDRKFLEEDLYIELVEKGKRELKEKIGEGEIFIEEATSATASAKTFSHKVGDDTPTLKLSMSVTVTSVSVARSYVIEFAREKLKNNIPEGFVLKDDQIEIEFKLRDVKDNVFDLEVSIVSNLLPEVKIEEIKKSIAGKYPNLARDYLTDIAGFTRAEIIINPNLPSALKTLPRVPANITIEVQGER